MEFTFTPYVGALPITFEMNAKEVGKIIGPAKSHRIIDGARKESRSAGRPPCVPIHVFYSTAGKVAEIGFGKGSLLKYKGIDLMQKSNLIRTLASEDKPKEIMGIVVFLKLGIAMGVRHDKGDDKNISVFCKGRWDEFSEKFVDLKL